MKKDILKYNILLLIIFFLSSCIGESDTVTSSSGSNGGSTASVGTDKIAVQAIYPDNADTDIPVDTNIVISFTKPVNPATLSGNITIPGATINTITSTSDDRIVVVELLANLSYLTAYTVNISTGIYSSDGDALDQNYSYSFTTGSDDSSLLDPQVIVASRVPQNGDTNVQTSTDYIYVSFTKDMNAATINAASFTISGGAASGAPASVTSKIYRLPLSTLAYNTVYTVTLDNLTIADSSANLLTGGNYTWTFTTEADSWGGSTPAQAINAVWLTNTTDTTTEINFTLVNPEQPVLCQVDYGLTSALGSSQTGVGTTEVSVQKLSLTGLTAGTRYYFNLDANGTAVTDYPGVSPARQLTFVTTGGSSAISSSASIKSQVNAVQAEDSTGAYDGSSFVIWDEGGTSVYGHYFDNSNPAILAWGGDGDLIYNGGITSDSLKIFPDKNNGAILAYKSGGNIYVKRIYDTGAAVGFGFSGALENNWGNSAATGTNLGSGSNVSAIIVDRDLTGFDSSTNFDSTISSITSGTAEAFTANANDLYDFDVDFSAAGIVTGGGGDFLINQSSNSNSEITSVGGGVGYRHVLSQTTDVVDATGTYTIGDVSTTQGYTASDHIIRNMNTEAIINSYQSSVGNLFLYSEEGATAAGWLGVNDIVYDGTNYREIQALSTINFASGNTTVRSSATDNATINYLRSTGNLVTVIAGDFVINTTTGGSANVSSIVDAGNEVELDSAIFSTGGGESFRIYSALGGVISSGTSNGIIASPRLYDFSNSWGPDGVANDDIVENSTTGNYSYITDNSNATYLILATHIFTILGHNYSIYASTTIRATNTSSSNYDFKLTDSAGNFTGGTSVQVGDMVTNTGTGDFARASAISATAVELDGDIFTASGQNYEIYNGSYNSSVYSAGTTNDPLASFLQFQTYNNISTAASTALTTYNSLANGIADTPPANPLYDDGGNFAAVSNSDFVANLTTGDRARVDNSTFSIRTRALDMTADIMNNGDSYNILNFNPAISDANILAYGISSTATATLTDGSKDFTALGVDIGDIIYSVNSSKYAVVEAVGTTTLTLNKDIFAGANEFYLVLNSGIRAMEVGTNDADANPFNDTNADFTNVSVGDIVRNITLGQDATVISVNSATNLTLSSDIWSAAGQKYIIVQPRVLFAYDDGGNIYSDLVNLRDGSIHSNVDICTSANNMNSPVLIDNNSDRYFILYNNTSDSTIRGKAIDGAGTFLIGTDATTTGTSIAPGTIIDVKYDKSGGFYLLYDNGTNIVMTRKNSLLNTPAGWIDFTIVSSSYDAAFTVDSTGNTLVAFSDATNDIYLRKYNTTGGTTWTSTMQSINTYENNSSTNNLRIFSDENDGVFVAWADNRYYIENGIVVFVQHVDSTGTLSWDADSGAGTDWQGFFFGSTGTYDLDLTDLFSLVLYNDGGSPFGINVLWRDDRDGDFDIYYQYKGVP